MIIKNYNITRVVDAPVRGTYTSGVIYQIRVPDRNWTQYLSPPTQQKYGQWDTDDCWDDSGCTVLEAQLNYLEKTGQLSPQAVSWYQLNGFKDSNGFYRLSPRAIGIESGRLDNGNDPFQYIQLVKKYGMLPLSSLTYSDIQAYACPNQEAFVDDYFNSQLITPAMESIARQALQWVTIDEEYIGAQGQTPELQDIQAALCQSPLLIGIPVPAPVSLWNETNIPYTGGAVMQHCVAIINDCSKNYPIQDNYVPYYKFLASNYYIPEVINIVVNAVQPASINPVPQPIWTKIWTAIFNFFNGNKPTGMATNKGI